MGKLMGFLGGFAGSMADQMKLDRADKKRKEEKDEEFKTQLNYAKVARAMQLTQDAATAAPVERADGDPFVAGPGGHQQKFQKLKPAVFDLETGDVREAATWVDAGTRAVAAPDPIRVKAGETLYNPDGTELMTGKPKPMSEYERERIGVLRAKGGGGGGITADQELDNSRADEQLDLARAAADRQARQDAIAEANARATSYLDQIDELKTAPDPSGGSELSRFMAAQNAPRSAQTNKAAAKEWIRKAKKDEVFGEFGIGASSKTIDKPPPEGTVLWKGGKKYKVINGEPVEQ